MVIDNTTPSSIKNIEINLKIDLNIKIKPRIVIRKPSLNRIQDNKY